MHHPCHYSWLYRLLASGEGLRRWLLNKMLTPAAFQMLSSAPMLQRAILFPFSGFLPVSCWLPFLLLLILTANGGLPMAVVLQ
jgi:hypothetical protein